MKLGKQDYVSDERTVQLANYMTPIRIPPNYDFDKGRRAIPVRVFGNDDYRNCVIAARAHGQMRLARITHRQTPQIGDRDVVREYKNLTGCKKPGDVHDKGLSILHAHKHWRSDGWTVGKHYSIAAYGELEPQDTDLLRTSIYILHGVYLGFALPLAAKGLTRQRIWAYAGENGPEWVPGSWGGQCAYCKAYSSGDIFHILTWGKQIAVTGAFVRKFCDEAWAVLERFTEHENGKVVNVEGIRHRLRKISSI